MPDSQLDIKSLYNEGCNALRHYSVCVMTMRNITIVQGFDILSAAIYLIKEKEFLASLSVSLFGLLFTAVLYMIQKNYWLHFNAVLKTIKAFEETLGGDELKPGPWMAYREQRGKRHRQLRWKYTVLYGPAFLLLLAL